MTRLSGWPSPTIPWPNPWPRILLWGWCNSCLFRLQPRWEMEKSSLIISPWQKNAFYWSLQEVRPQVMEVGTQPQSTLPLLLPCLRWEYIKNALHGLLSVHITFVNLTLIAQDNGFPSTPVNGLATPHVDQDESDHDRQHPGLPQVWLLLSFLNPWVSWDILAWKDQNSFFNSRQI